VKRLVFKSVPTLRRMADSEAGEVTLPYLLDVSASAEVSAIRT